MKEDKILNIFLVDDETDLFTIFKYKFKEWIKSDLVKMSFFESADKLIEAIDALKNKDPEVLILCDLNMPGTNGMEFLDFLNNEKIPNNFFMLTAYSDEQTRSKAFSKGANEYFTKPVDFIDLKKKINDTYSLEVV